MNRKIRKVIEQIRPSLRADGGDIDLVGYRDGVVSVRLKGACRTCDMSEVTIREGVEAALRREIPEVRRVVRVGF